MWITRIRPGWSRRLVSTFGALAASIAVCGCAGTSPLPAANTPPDANEPTSSDAGALAREIEEADIVKLVDGYFYLANRWTGLRIIDARDMNQPRLAGRVAMQGRAVELFVRDDHAFILSTADFLYCAGEPVGFSEDTEIQAGAVPDYEGSRVTVVDVADDQSPSIVAEFDLDGFVYATRRVGDVLYAAGAYADDYRLPEDDTDTNGEVSSNGTDPAPPQDTVVGEFGYPRAFVASINIADPAHPFLVDRIVFLGEDFEINVTTQNAMFVAGDDPTVANTTLVSYVDIADPDGAIALRDRFRVRGVIHNRFFMDEYNGVFRLVAEEFVGQYPTIWTVALYTYDVSDPDHIIELARLPLFENQGASSVRFDGHRAYTVTSTINDPLLVLDLSDPHAPQIAGQIEILGLSTHLIPLGERLINFGVDNSYLRQPSVTLYDVTDPAAPKPMSRIVLGARGSDVTSEANFDEKAVQVLESEQLVLVPFAYVDKQTLEAIDGLLLIDLLPTRMAERGDVTHRGLVRRSGISGDQLWVLSDEAFKVVDVSDRDRPEDVAVLHLITDQELLDSGLWGCRDSARYHEDAWEIYGPDYYDWYGSPMLCGAGTPMAVMLLALCLVTWRFATHRR
ncbi:MAG: hypothetical protein GY842_22650 [bacterium]|nr:hypothetical protein [bacterium]